MHCLGHFTSRRCDGPHFPDLRSPTRDSTETSSHDLLRLIRNVRDMSDTQEAKNDLPIT